MRKDVVIHKPITKKGVHCSIVRYTKVNSERNINLKSSTTINNCEWRRSRNRDINEFSPIYAANNSTTKVLQIQKRELMREGKRDVITNNYIKDDDYDDDDDERDDKLALRRIICQRKKALPLNMGYYNNTHNFVNRERVKRDILPLHRVRHLDELALEQAKIMAAQQSRDHSDLDTLMSNLTKSAPCRRIGENICRGTSVQLIHKKMMIGPKYAADRNNILDRRYSSFGIGVAPCVDGIFYVCQIYKG